MTRGSAQLRAWCSSGRGVVRPHDQVLRNQTVGSRCRFGRLPGRDSTTVMRDQDVFGVGLGILDEHIEVAVLVEDAGVEQFELGIVSCRAARFSSTSCA